jgi:hypothetical protein
MYITCSAPESTAQVEDKVCIVVRGNGEEGKHERWEMWRKKLERVKGSSCMK